MLLFGLTLLLCVMTYHVVRGGMVSVSGTTIAGMDPQGIGLGILSFLAAAYYFGPLFGMAIVLSVMIHEYGHVVAYRICGHHDARFRLIPLLGGVAISDRAPDSDVEDFFISLMGPGICLAPMVLAFFLARIFDTAAPDFAAFCWTFATVTGALNFFNLLPFWPLDGGRCMRVILDKFVPDLTHHITLGMSAMLTAAAVAMQSIVLTAVALIGLQSLLRWSNASSNRPQMTDSQAILALGAYLVTAGAHFCGGYLLLIAYL